MLFMPSTADSRVRQSLPGRSGLPIVGTTYEILRNPNRFAMDFYRNHGPVGWTSFLGQTVVFIHGPDAIEEVLRDRSQAFESSAWEHFIGPFFHRGLMLMDFDEHRAHRRVMQAAFKRPQMERYFANMQPCIERGVDYWPEGRTIHLGTRLKRLTLDIASDIFMGERLGRDSRKITAAFIACVRGGSTVLRASVPFSRWKKGLDGRVVLEEMFYSRVGAKRRSPSYDLFSRLCEATDEDGNRYTDEDVVNHMIFLMMAAHDTSTITLTSLFYQLARDPRWQEIVREEVCPHGSAVPSLSEISKLPKLDMAVKESLRVMTPVPAIARRAAKDVDVMGTTIPEGAFMAVGLGLNHVLPEYWSEPRRFDPERFNEERAEHRQHPFLFNPFGGGVHKCIGMHFGEMEIKAIAHHVLKRYRITVPEGYVMPVDNTSLPVARDGLPVRLERIDGKRRGRIYHARRRINGVAERITELVEAP